MAAIPISVFREGMGDGFQCVFCNPMCDRNRLDPSSNERIVLRGLYAERRWKCDRNCPKHTNACDQEVLISQFATIRNDQKSAIVSRSNRAYTTLTHLSLLLGISLLFPFAIFLPLWGCFCFLSQGFWRLPCPTSNENRKRKKARKSPKARKGGSG